MSDYQQLHWDSINLLKNHMYRYLATPLSHALGRLALIQQAGLSAETQHTIEAAGWDLEQAASLIQAWAALIHVESGGTIPEGSLTEVVPDRLPTWLVSELSALTDFRPQFRQAVLVHAPAFFQSLLLMAQLGKTAGTLRHLLITDGRGSQSGIWARAVFDPPSDGRYRNLSSFVSAWGDGPIGQEIAFQVQTLGGFLKISRARFSLQDNLRAHQQSFTAVFPASVGQPLESMTEDFPQVESAVLPAQDFTEMGQVLAWEDDDIDMFDLPDDILEIAPPDEFGLPDDFDSGESLFEMDDPPDTLILPPEDLR